MMGFRNGRSKSEEKVVSKSSVIPPSIQNEPWESERQSYERKIQQHEEPRDQHLLRQLEMQLQKVPLDDIAGEVLNLTYGEMVSLVGGIRTADTQNLIPETLNLADVLHKWAVDRVKAKGGENDHQDQTQD